MEQITRSARTATPAAGLTPWQRTALADHLRALDRSEIAARGASTPDVFLAAIRQMTAPADVCAAGLAQELGFVRIEHYRFKGHGPIQMGFTVNGTGKEFLRSNPEVTPAAVVPIRRDRGPARLPVREPLMGERALVAELAKAA